MKKNTEQVIFKFLKRIMLLTIGSGLLGNALYFYGMSFYQGYIQRLGFEYVLFPITWGDSIFWTYIASQHIGMDIFELITGMTWQVTAVTFVSVYLIMRFWFLFATPNEKAERERAKRNRKFKRSLVKYRKDHPRMFKFVIKPIFILLGTEHAILSFLASYFFLVVLVFLPIFIVVWVFFPSVGLNHGKQIASEKYTKIEESLCVQSSSFWERCVKFELEKEIDEKMGKSVVGRMIVKKGNLAGIITEFGPLTITLPKSYHYISTRNKCFEKECDDENTTKSSKERAASKSDKEN